MEFTWNLFHPCGYSEMSGDLFHRVRLWLACTRAMRPPGRPLPYKSRHPTTGVKETKTGWDLASRASYKGL